MSCAASAPTRPTGCSTPAASDLPRPHGHASDVPPRWRAHVAAAIVPTPCGWAACERDRVPASARSRSRRRAVTPEQLSVCVASRQATRCAGRGGGPTASCGRSHAAASQSAGDQRMTHARQWPIRGTDSFAGMAFVDGKADALAEAADAARVRHDRIGLSGLRRVDPFVYLTGCLGVPSLGPVCLTPRASGSTCAPRQASWSPLAVGVSGPARGSLRCSLSTDFAGRAAAALSRTHRYSVAHSAPHPGEPRHPREAPTMRQTAVAVGVRSMMSVRCPSGGIMAPVVSLSLRVPTHLMDQGPHERPGQRPDRPAPLVGGRLSRSPHDRMTACRSAAWSSWSAWA